MLLSEPLLHERHTTRNSVAQTRRQSCELRRRTASLVVVVLPDQGKYSVELHRTLHYPFGDNERMIEVYSESFADPQNERRHRMFTDAHRIALVLFDFNRHFVKRL